MKNLKFLTVPLTALALWGFTACAKVEPQKVEFGEGYTIESRIKDSEVRLYKNGFLVVKKMVKDNKPVYEFFDAYTKEQFAEANLHSEIIYLNDKRGELVEDTYGDMKAKIGDGWVSVPLWKDLFDLKDEKVQGQDIIFYYGWTKAYGLFVDFLNGEQLLEKKYNKDF